MNKFEKTLHFIKDVIHEDSPFYGQIYLVGGCVRDELLGERYSDIDLLVNMPNGQKAFIEYMCAEHADRCKGPFYYQRYGTTAMDVIIDDSLTLVECVEPHIEEYADDDITLLETRFCSLEEDASRRDYTCNALYKNLHTGKVLDPTGVRIKLLIIILGITCVLPMATIAVLHNFKLIKDKRMLKREERLIPYITGTIYYGIAVWYMVYTHEPKWLIMYAVGGTLACLISTLVNIKWKISAHMAGMGGVLALLWQLDAMDLEVISPVWMMFFILVTIGLCGTYSKSWQVSLTE